METMIENWVAQALYEDSQLQKKIYKTRSWRDHQIAKNHNANPESPADTAR
jgi:hypothetical protein